MERERGKKREEKRKGGKTSSASASLPSHAIDIRVLWEGGGFDRVYMSRMTWK